MSQAKHMDERMKSQCTRTTQDFTLVELLTVIMIVLVLMSLLLPALARSREQAKRAACVSNLHQVGNALMMYALKNKQTMPGGKAKMVGR